MEKEKIKEGLRALYPKVQDELIEAAATYPQDSMVNRFIHRIITRAASYGHAKETIGDLCPVGHELNRMLGGMIGDIKSPAKGKMFSGIEAKTFEQWKEEKKSKIERLQEMEEWIDSVFSNNPFQSPMFKTWDEPERWSPTLRLRDDLKTGECGNEPGIKWANFDFGKPEKLTEDRQIMIAKKMYSMSDSRLSGEERDIWIVSHNKQKGEFEVWEGRYNECNGPHYRKGSTRRHGDWIGWMEKSDYTPYHGNEKYYEIHEIPMVLKNKKSPPKDGVEVCIWFSQGNEEKYRKVYGYHNNKLGYHVMGLNNEIGVLNEESIIGWSHKSQSDG